MKLRTKLLEKVFFLFFIFSLSYYSFVVFLIHSRLIIEYPHFFRTASPLLYALSISFYFYYKSYSKLPIFKQKSNLLLLAIPIINIIELLPFYVQSAQEKRNYILNVSVNQDDIIYSIEGWIPNSWHFILQLSLGILLFSSVLFHIIKTQYVLNRKAHHLFLWFKWASFFQLICFVVLLFLIIFDSESLIIYNFGAVFFGAIQLIVAINLFLQPQLLYGSIELKTNKRLKTNNSVNSLSDQSVESYYLKIEQYFEENDTFLNINFRQNKLAESLDISKNKLSYIINTVYQLNFNQLLNKKRIEKVIIKLNTDKQWDNLSLSGIGQEVGFKSRTTFTKAFKANTGMTPSKYLKSLS
jgi:AraC-like DNA-binding protein